MVVEPSTRLETPTEQRARRPAAGRTLAALWLASGLFVSGVGVGAGWDRRWHATHPFEDFWSPPHLFIYTCLLLTVGVVAVIAFSPALRARLGDDVRLPGVSLGVPAPLLLLGCGLASLGLAGALDAVWHTAFGLDETGWSLPHALLGHGVLLTCWGFVACRLALRPHRPLSPPGQLLLGWALLATAQDVLGGPLTRNMSPRSVRAIASLPALAADPRAQHTFRIYLAWHLDRTNPLFLPVAAFTTGFGLALVRRLNMRRGAWMLASAAIVAFVPLVSNPQLGPARLWEPLPFLAAAGAFLLARRAGISTGWASAIAGWATCCWLLVFVPRPALALLAGPLAMAGAWAGTIVAEVIERPAPRRVFTLTSIIAGAIPTIMGALDLYLRAHTP